MALSPQAVESMLKAMDIIATNRDNDISYDQTIVCTIVDNSQAEKQSFYTVTSDGNIKFKAYVLSSQDATEYDVGDQVYVKIPNGEYDKKKVIEGYYVSDSDVVPVTYVSPLDSFIDMDTLTKENPDYSESLIANISQEIPVWAWDITQLKQESYADDLQANNIYDTLGLRADFKCLLNNYNMRKGSYGLRLDLYVRLTPTSKKHMKRSLYLDSSEMFGNPYAFTIFAPQSKTFDLSNVGIVDKMILYFYQNNDFIYFDGSTEVPINSDPALATVPNIFLKNIYIAFGSDITKVTDNTVRLYSIVNDLEFAYDMPSDATNQKVLAFQWFNKDEKGQYIGFSDGIVDFQRDENNDKIPQGDYYAIQPYDELDYMEIAEAENRLVEQSDNNCPSDENGLDIAASVKEATVAFGELYTAAGVTLRNTIAAFEQRVSNLSIEHEGNRVTALEYFEGENGLLTKFDAWILNYETKYKELLDWYNSALGAASHIEYWQINNVTPDEEAKKQYNEDQNTWTHTCSNYYHNIYNSYLELFKLLFTYDEANAVRVTVLEEIEHTIKTYYPSFQDIYDTYAIKIKDACADLDKIIAELNTSLLVEVNTSTDIQIDGKYYVSKEKNITSTFDENASSNDTFHYAFKTPIQKREKKDLSSYDNRYCIYWYRYVPGGSDKDGLVAGEWERIPHSYWDKENNPQFYLIKDSSYTFAQVKPNIGLPNTYFETKGEFFFNKKYNSSTDYFGEIGTIEGKDFRNPGYLTVYLNPGMKEEKFKVILFYNHNKYESNELVFTNKDKVPDSITMDESDAIFITHGDMSADSYQTKYAANNLLINAADASYGRKLLINYDGMLGDNNVLADAQIFWYIPRNTTMLTVSQDKLLSSDYNFKTDYYRTGRICVDGPVYVYQGPGENYSKCKNPKVPGEYLSYSKGDEITTIYDERNGYYSLTANNSTNINGRWIKAEAVTIIKNEETYMDGYACFYKTIGYTEQEKEVVDKDGNKTKVKEKVVKPEDLIFEYKIKDYYSPTSLQNTIFCIVKKGAYVFETSIPFIFGTQGTSGTDYTIIIHPTTEQLAVQNDKSLEVGISAYDYDNQPLDIISGKGSSLDLENIKLFNPSIKWRGPTTFNFSIFNKVVHDDGTISEETATGVPITNGDITTVSEKHYCGIAQLDVDLYEDEGKSVKTLSTLYPVAWSENDYYIEGATSIVYDSSGSNPVYYKDSYKLFENHKNEPAQGNLEWKILYYLGNSGNTPSSYFDLSKDEDGKYNLFDLDDVAISTDSDKQKEISFYANYMPILNPQDNKIVPSLMYIGDEDGTELKCYPVVQCYQDTRLVWAQPIIISQNRYPNAMLNGWDGKFKIDEENGTIMSTMVAAGIKNKDNTYSGVIMGDVSGDAATMKDNKTGLGVYGYNRGQQSFGLNVDGTAFFGKSGRGRISIDGNKGTISSASYQQTRTVQEDGTILADSGMMIDLDDGFIDMRGIQRTSNEAWNEWTDEQRRGCETYEEYQEKYGTSYASGKKDSGAQSLIHLDVLSPYFRIRGASQTDLNKDLIHIADEDYYLQSNNYTPGIYSFVDGVYLDEENFFVKKIPVKDKDGNDTYQIAYVDINGKVITDKENAVQGAPGDGLHFDLQEGILDAYNFKLTSKNILLDSTEKAKLFFVIKDDDGNVILNAGEDSYYLQSSNYDDIERHGTKISLNEGAINSFDFTLTGNAPANSIFNGSYLLMTNEPHFQIHLKEVDSSDKSIIKYENDLIMINTSDFFLRSKDWDPGEKIIIKPISQRYATITVSALNVRTGPGMSYPATHCLYQGDKVPIYKEKDGWYSLTPGGEIGSVGCEWISKRYQLSTGAYADSLTVSTEDVQAPEEVIRKGMNLDIYNGKIELYKNTNSFLINSHADYYPFQLGQEATGYTFQVGWDGSLKGGSEWTWSITSAGKATFSNLSSNNAWIGGGTIGGCRISSGSISGSGWSLGADGATFSGIKIKDGETTYTLNVSKDTLQYCYPNWNGALENGQYKRKCVTGLITTSLDVLIPDTNGTLPSGVKKKNISIAYSPSYGAFTTNHKTLTYIGYSSETEETT